MIFDNVRYEKRVIKKIMLEWFKLARHVIKSIVIIFE